MAIIKCKMCGGDLNLVEGQSVAECEYCGSMQTVPAADDEKKLNLFARANRLRASCEFDKAAGIYESIASEFTEEAEAYWGLVLCKYGIEYVDDPATGKKIPTCHRSSFESVMDDPDLDQALENADIVARKVYRDEAKAIEELRKGIIEVSGKEEPYDIFICYKETAENGERTLDSVLAQDIYDELTGKGYRVFFSRITLEDKLGQEYEPYIFAALNSAKIMLAFGTDYEYYNAVWVKNEWSRYLKLMASDKSKYLIPCYKGIDAYDMPKEFAKLQAQDLGKVGATQDLLRGIEKIIGGIKGLSSSVLGATAGIGDTMVTRGQFALEDGDFVKAAEYFDKALDQNPMNGAAYLGKFLAGLKISDKIMINDFVLHIDSFKDFSRAIQFSQGAEKAVLEKIYDEAKLKYLRACVAAGLKRVLDKEKREIAKKQAEACHKDAIYAKAEALLIENTEQSCRRAAEIFATIPGWKDANQKAEQALEQTETWRKQAKLASAMISAGYKHTVGVKADGTVVAVGNNDCGQCDVSHWTDIVAVSAGYKHTVGLRTDGTVLATKFTWDKKYYKGQCDVSGWVDIVAVSAGDNHTVGLKSDGTVVATKYTGREDHYYGQCDVSDWTDIVAVSTGDCHTVGLKSDGTVVAVGHEVSCYVSDWTDIVAISARDDYTVGLKADGTVVAVGYNRHGRRHVTSSDWQNIVAVSAGYKNTVGLKSDGTVLATGDKKCSQCNVSAWVGIMATSAGDAHTVGLKSDGTVVVVGDNDYDQCNVSGWKLFNSIDTLEQERKEATARREQLRKEEEARREQRRKEEETRREQQLKKAEAYREQQRQWREANRCQYCGGELKGLFGKKCVSCGRPKDY